MLFRSPVLDPEVPPRVKALKRWRDWKAENLEIDPSIVATKALITSIAVQNPKTAGELEGVDEIKEWQKRLFGEEIIEILKSEI